MGLVASEAAYREGRPWLEAVKSYLKGNLDFTRSFFKKEMPEMKLIEPEGTYLIWVDASAYGLSNEELEHKILYDGHDWLDMGSIFGKEGEGFVRFNLAGPRDTLEKGLRQLKEGFEK